MRRYGWVSFPHPPSRPRAVALERVGIFFVGLAVIAAGLRQVITHDFVRIAPGALEGATWRPWAAAAVGALLVGVGGFLLAHGWRSRAAWTMAGLFAIDLVLLQMPPLLANPLAGYLWTNPAKLLCLAGGCILIATRQDRTPDERARRLAIACTGAFLVICGIQHIVYAGFVDTLVPAWIPPGARFWTWFTAAALVLGGTGLALPRTSALAALCAAIMVALWVVLLHIPRAVTTGQPAEFDGVCEALAISGVLLVLHAAALTRPRPS